MCHLAAGLAMGGVPAGARSLSQEKGGQSRLGALKQLPTPNIPTLNLGQKPSHFLFIYLLLHFGELPDAQSEGLKAISLLFNAFALCFSSTPRVPCDSALSVASRCHAPLRPAVREVDSLSRVDIYTFRRHYTSR